jgi:hypothetical protein
MSTHLIPPNDLDILATAPQCVDNQFVPPVVFKRISKGKKTLKDVVDRILEEHGGDPFVGPSDKDANLLLRTQRNEYNRSLLYARQIVVNRAAFWNSASLVVSELTDDVESLAELIRQNTIVPYLYKESSFDQPPGEFELFLGEKAMNRLVDALGGDQVRCVRLAIKENENEKQTRIFSARFRNEFIKLLAYEERETVSQIVQLLLPENVSEQTEKALMDKILDVSDKIDKLSREQAISRKLIYQQFIVEPGTNESHGAYRSDPFTFEIKKWVDAIYTSNLPDALKILTFVPEGFPTAYDLGMNWSLGGRRKQRHSGTDLIEEVVDRASNAATWKLWNEFQTNATLVLPSPDQLTHKDILEIREFNAWHQMMNTLEKFLNPINTEDKFDYNYATEEMWNAFDRFNRALEAWYLKKTALQRADVSEKLAVVVGRIYQWGEWMVGLLFGEKGAAIPILPAQGVQPPPLDEGDIRFGIEAGLFFVSKEGIDRRRSQLVQRMEKELVVGADEVRDMLREIIKLFPEAAPRLKPSLSAEMEG